MTYAPKCLKCGKALPDHDPIDGSDTKPYDGAVAICFECGEVMVFEGRGFRSPTPEEFQEFFADQDFVKAVTLVALKVSGAKDPTAVIINDKGVATVIAPEPDETCEMCGEMKECRSYGPRKPDGVRMRVCFPCARKNEDELMRAFDERLEGR